MSILLMSKAFNAKRLTSTQKLLLLALADHANDEGNHVYPGQSRLMLKTSMSRTTVRDTLKALYDIDILQVVREATPSSSTEYRINTVKLDELVNLTDDDDPSLPTPPSSQNPPQQAQGEGRQPTQGHLPQEGRQPTLGRQTTQGEGRHATQGGSPNDPGRVATQPREGRQTTQGGSPADPESLINHPLNNNESVNDPHAPPVSKIWTMIDAQLRAEMRRHEYTSWVQSLKPVSCDGSTFTLAAINPFGCDWVASRLTRRIESLLIALYNHPVALQVIVSSPS